MEREFQILKTNLQRRISSANKLFVSNNTNTYSYKIKFIVLKFICNRDFYVIGIYLSN